RSWVAIGISFSSLFLMRAQWQGIDFLIYQKLDRSVNLYKHKEVIMMFFSNNHNNSVPGLGKLLDKCDRSYILYLLE
ncbi:hypothetical protein, partial [Microcoleus sp. herbarium14]|uniref:hypothetical protein n=1 Tax=Microcoleus sp. herbarium14 TaxID=3055439 RepID=UPI002FD18BB2